MTVRTELMALQKEHRVLRPETVVEWARKNKKSAIHSAIEWDDTEAAHEYRLWQVRHLIAVNVVNVEGQRQILSLSIDRQNGGGYRSIDNIMASPKMRSVLLSDALMELKRVQLKYGALKELAGVWTAMAAVPNPRKGKLTQMHGEVRHG